MIRANISIRRRDVHWATGLPKDQGYRFMAGRWSSVGPEGTLSRLFPKVVGLDPWESLSD